MINSHPPDAPDPTAGDVIRYAVQASWANDATVVTDAIIAALTEAGYRIVRDDAAGMVDDDDRVHVEGTKIAEFDIGPIAAAAPDTGLEGA